MNAVPNLPQALHVADADNVAIALSDIAAGTRVALGSATVMVTEAVGMGHKFALVDVPAGAEVRKYGFPIGRARIDIGAGAWVHSHNLETQLSGTLDYTFEARDASAPATPTARVREFLGYRRADGRVGTRNEIWILCTVGCVANTARRIAERASTRFTGRVDGIHAITHPFGCSQLGDDLDNTERVLASLAQHPNTGGVLIVGLGCESLQMKRLLGAIGAHDASRLRFFDAQQSQDETEDGIAAVAQLVEVASADRRESCPLSALTLGLKCGGSDGFSGITANPLAHRRRRCICRRRAAWHAKRHGRRREPAFRTGRGVPQALDPGRLQSRQRRGRQRVRRQQALRCAPLNRHFNTR